MTEIPASWITNHVRAHLELELDNAIAGLLAVAPPEHLTDIQEEVQRRATLMGTLHATRSVYDDIANCRWPR